MPTFDVVCSKCEAPKFDAYVSKWDSLPPCEKCGSPTERLWSTVGYNSVASAFPYVTSNITGSPVEVKSPKHLEELCRKAGVSHRPDVAWSEKRIAGFDKRGKKLIYKEGNGVGMPNCWV